MATFRGFVSFNFKAGVAAMVSPKYAFQDQVVTGD